MRIQRSPHTKKEEDLPLIKWPALNPCARGCVFYRSQKKNPKNCILQPHVHQAQDAEAVFRMQKQSIGGSGVCHGQVSISIACLHLDIKTQCLSHTQVQILCWHPLPLVALGYETPTCEQVSTQSITYMIQDQLPTTLKLELENAD